MGEPRPRQDVLTLERERWGTLERLLETVPAARATELPELLDAEAPV